MTQVNVQDAKSRLSDLLARVERGEEVVIARAGKPVARMVPIEAVPPRRFGDAAFVVPDNFDEPLDPAELSDWE